MKYLRYLLLISAILLSSWMAWSSFTQVRLPGCGTTAGCADVLVSPYSSLLGVPLSLFGVLVYVALLVASARTASAPRLPLHAYRRRWVLCRFLEWLVIFSAAWFFILQLLVLRKFCPRCSGIHACAALSAILGLRSAKASPPPEPPLVFVARPRLHKLMAPAAALGAVLILAICQTALAHLYHPSEGAVAVPAISALSAKGEAVASPSSQIFLSDSPVRLMLFGDQSISFPPTAVPTLHGGADPLASPPSGVPIIFLQDWTCSHCQRLHQLLLQLVSVSLGAPVSDSQTPDPPPAMFFLPAWRDTDGEVIHRLMLTAWLGARPVYAAAEAALLDGSLPPTPDAVRAFIQTRNGASWPDLWTNLAPSVDSIMSLGRAALEASDSRISYSTLPQLIASHATLVGAPGEHELVAFVLAASNAATREHLILNSLPSASRPRVAGALTMGPNPGFSPSANLSDIAFEKESLSLPSIKSGEDARAVFVFSNTGTEPLTITGVQTSCGCTVVNDWQQTLSPGRTGSIKAEFHSAGRPPGLQLKTIIVRSNSKRHPSVTLSVSVDIIIPSNAPDSSPE